MQSGREQDRDPGETAGQAEPDEWGRTRRDAAPPGEKRDVNRDRRDYHRGEAGGHVLFGESNAAVAAEKETAADDQRRAPLSERRFWRALPSRKGLQDYASQKKA